MPVESHHWIGQLGARYADTGRVRGDPFHREYVTLRHERGRRSGQSYSWATDTLELLSEHSSFKQRVGVLELVLDHGGQVVGRVQHQLLVEDVGAVGPAIG